MTVRILIGDVHDWIAELADESVHCIVTDPPFGQTSLAWDQWPAGRAEHPTQKPIATVLPLIKYSCSPGGVVFDPFAGSGTVGIAAQRLGHDCILGERNPKYAELSQRRIDADAGSLFADAIYEAAE